MTLIKRANLRDLGRYLESFARTDQEDPLKIFRFHLEIEGFSRFGFQKVTGLLGQTDVAEYREGGGNTTPSKSPGLTKFPDITCERGQILAAGAGDVDILNWYKQVFDVSAKRAQSEGAFRRDVDVVQFNKEGDEVRRWRCVECWPKDMKPMGDLDAMSNDNSIESMVLVHEGYDLVAA